MIRSKNFLLTLTLCLSASTARAEMAWLQKVRADHADKKYNLTDKRDITEAQANLCRRTAVASFATLAGYGLKAILNKHQGKPFSFPRKHKLIVATTAGLLAINIKKGMAFFELCNEYQDDLNKAPKLANKKGKKAKPITADDATQREAEEKLLREKQAATDRETARKQQEQDAKLAQDRAEEERAKAEQQAKAAADHKKETDEKLAPQADIKISAEAAVLVAEGKQLIVALRNYKPIKNITDTPHAFYGEELTIQLHNFIKHYFALQETKDTIANLILKEPLQWHELSDLIKVGLHLLDTLNFHLQRGCLAPGVDYVSKLTTVFEENQLETLYNKILTSYNTICLIKSIHFLPR